MLKFFQVPTDHVEDTKQNIDICSIEIRRIFRGMILTQDLLQVSCLNISKFCLSKTNLINWTHLTSGKIIFIKKTNYKKKKKITLMQRTRKYKWNQNVIFRCFGKRRKMSVLDFVWIQISTSQHLLLISDSVKGIMVNMAENTFACFLF